MILKINELVNIIKNNPNIYKKPINPACKFVGFFALNENIYKVVIGNPQCAMCAFKLLKKAYDFTWPTFVNIY